MPCGNWARAYRAEHLGKKCLQTDSVSEDGTLSGIFHYGVCGSIRDTWRCAVSSLSRLLNAEQPVSGWIVTYIIEQRGGGPNSGYISAGFYGGLTVGRVALIWVNANIGERKAIYLYTFVGIGYVFYSHHRTARADSSQYLVLK